jgi:hypothetical protein
VEVQSSARPRRRLDLGSPALLGLVRKGRRHGGARQSVATKVEAEQRQGGLRREVTGRPPHRRLWRRRRRGAKMSLASPTSSHIELMLSLSAIMDPGNRRLWGKGSTAAERETSGMGSWEKRKRERGRGAVIRKGRERRSAVARKPRSRMERSAIEGSRDCSRMERSAAGGRDARKPRRRWGGGWQNRAPLVVDVYATYLCSSRD